MQLIIMNMFTNTIDTLLICYFLIKLLNKTFFDKKRWALTLGALIIFNTLMNSIFGLANMLGFISIFIMSTIIYSYLFDIKFIKILIYNIVGIILMFTVEIIVISTVAVVFKINPSQILDINVYKMGSIIIAKTGFYLIVRLLIEKTKTPKNIKFNCINQVVLIGFFNIVIIFMTFTLYKNIEIEPNIGYVYLIGMGVGTLIFDWLIYKITQKIIHQSQQEIIWKMKEEEFHKKDFYLKSMNDILQTIKSQSHDLNNYLSTLYGLIYLEKFEESKKFIIEINNRASNMNSIIDTNHPVITALITMKKNKAFENNIDIVFDIDLPEEFQFDFVDLSIIIGNLLDNAIEACELIKEETKRKVKLSIYIRDEYLTIEVINTKNESIRVETNDIIGRFTTKDNHENHGYGLININYLVEEYNGTMNIEDLGMEFKVDICLFIGEKIK